MSPDDLRKAGHEIDKRLIAVGDKHVAEYRLVKAATRRAA